MRSIARGKLILLFWALASLALIAASTAFAQSEGRRYFPETGHWVSGDFLDFYENSPHAESLYGFPITEAYTDREIGLRVQYFQRARFEYHPENAAGERVELSQLGHLLYAPGRSTNIAIDNSACELIAENPFGSFPICYSFLVFYTEFGGVEQLGYPISELEFYGDRLMQYFEYARIEWYPELRPGSQITLGNLGTLHWQGRGFREEEIFGPQIILDLRTKVFLDTVTVSSGDMQTLFVTVHDQNLVPVSQAQVRYSVQLPNGDSIDTVMAPTGENGLTQDSFQVTSSELGLVEVIVAVTHQEKLETLRTSFRLWW